MQLNLFTALIDAYSTGVTDNQSVYEYVAEKANTTMSAMTQPVGKAEQRINVFKRKVRGIVPHYRYW
jgi:hypothetical protein